MKKWKIALTLLVTGTLSTTVLPQQDPVEDEQESTKAAAAQLTLDDLRTFTDVFSLIRRNYVEEIDDRTLLNAAINGMLSGLDPHSDFLPAPAFKQLDESAEGHYIGIGVDVGVEDQKIVIRKVIVPSPADSAGINPGDVITAIDGKPVKGRLLQKAIDELQGESGTSVQITLLTPEGEEKEVNIVREYVTLPTISLQLLDKNYGYFRISVFNRNSAPHLEETLESLKNDGVILQGLIIDLRNNPGGVLEQAVSMADGFLDEGLIVSTRGRNAVMQLEFEANEGQWLPGVPLFILVDRGTASASEVVAGALQDHGRAVIVGERTYGKGSVQSVLPLKNGDGIKLTTARYYTPAGRSIQAEGIQPDVIIEPIELPDSHDERLREADLDRHLVNEENSDDEIANPELSSKDDLMLKEVLGILIEAELLEGTFRGQDLLPLNKEEEQ